MGSLTGGFSPGRWLVVRGGTEEMFGEDLAGGGIRGGDMLVLDEHQDLFAAMGRSDAQMPDFAGVAQRDFPIGIDPVGAGAVFGLMGGVRCGLRQGHVGLGWGAPVHRLVGVFRQL